MAIADGKSVARDAVAFWQRQLPNVSEDLKVWLEEWVVDLQYLWGHVLRMNGSQAMWRELTDRIEMIDPTNSWTRHYDGIYFESQVLHITRLVREGQRRRKEQRPASLGRLLKAFEARPELLGSLSGPWTADALQHEADPMADRRHLNRLAREVFEVRDRAVAHVDVGEKLPSIAWEDLDAAIEAVTMVFEQYSLRLTGLTYRVRYDSVDWRNWKKIFTQPIFEGPSVNLLAGLD